MQLRSLIGLALVLCSLCLCLTIAHPLGVVHAASSTASVAHQAQRGVNGNPWGYDFRYGWVITSPPSAFCRYFWCISNFWAGRGYVVECWDGKYSKSGGLRGACSYHRGVWRILYRH
jgi:hypothetical protein